MKENNILGGDTMEKCCKVYLVTDVCDCDGSYEYDRDTVVCSTYEKARKVYAEKILSYQDRIGEIEGDNSSDDDNNFDHILNDIGNDFYCYISDDDSLYVAIFIEGKEVI